METQYSALNYRIALYFHEYRLAIYIDEKGHSDRINPDEEKFNISRAKYKMFRHIKESIKK